MHKTFGQRDYIDLKTGEFGYGAHQRGSRAGFGYFIRYCDCHRKVYLSEEEIWRLLRRTAFPIPVASILWERFVRWLKIPKIEWTVEFRSLEELKRIPLNRDERLRALARSGMSLGEISKYLGGKLTRQRIHQIVKT